MNRFIKNEGALVVTGDVFQLPVADRNLLQITNTVHHNDIN